MKVGFKDPIAPKNAPKKGKTPWDFRCPPYDERTSNFVDAGSHYGVGFTQPVGRVGNPKMRADVLPFGRPSTEKDDFKANRKAPQEFVE